MRDFRVREIQVQALFLPFICYLTLGKFLTLSEPQFPILYNGATQWKGLLRGLNETKLQQQVPHFGDALRIPPPQVLGCGPHKSVPQGPRSTVALFIILSIQSST